MKKIKDYIIDYLYILAGSFILAFAISFFLVPCMISTGGVSGVATVLYYVAKIPLSVTTLVINLALFFFGYRTLTKASLVKTLCGMLFFSGALIVTDFLASVMPYVVDSVTADIWVASIFGGIFVGLGVGLVVLREASTGGSDFAALMLHKIIPHISVATFILIVDSIVIIVSGILLPSEDIGLSNISIMLYSVASLYISSKVTDFIVVRGASARSIYVISNASKEIADAVMTRLERGVTAIKSYGCYSGEDKEMLMCIVRTHEVPKVLNIIKEYDKSAFTIVSEAKEVRGLGFTE